MLYKLIVFDLDGTILDTLGDLATSVNIALSVNFLPKRSVDEVRSFVGNGIRRLMERAVPEGSSEAQITAVHEAFTAHYREHCKDQTAPYDGIPALLTALREAGALTAVVSNKADYAVQELCKDYFPGQFDAVAGERAGVRRKPAPDAVLAILEQLGVSAEESIYIGDSDIDILTAQNAGMRCISVSWGFRSEEFLREHGASVIVDTPEALGRLLLEK